MPASASAGPVEFWIGDDDIVRTRWAAGTEVTLDLAEAAEAVRSELVGERRLPLLVLLDGIRGMDREARRFYGRMTGPSRIALVVTTPIARVVGSLATGLSRPATPVRLFGSEPEAIAWLLQDAGETT